MEKGTVREGEGAISALTDFISDTVPYTGKADEWNWKASMDGEYSTKSAYIIIAEARNESPSSTVPTELLESVLKTPAPHKARVNAWRCLRKRLATCDNLVKRHVAMSVEELFCNCCVSSEETTDHLFVLCPKVEKVWDEIQKWIGIHAMRPQNIAHHFNWFTHIGKDKKSGKLLKMLWVCTVWLLWKRRNESRFEGKVWDVQKLVLEIKIESIE